jgi:delta 1-pyrroline-5-carboxylate dehydrogenase
LPPVCVAAGVGVRTVAGAGLTLAGGADEAGGVDVANGADDAELELAAAASLDEAFLCARCLCGAARSAGTATAACSPTTFGDCVGVATAEARCGVATAVDFLVAVPMANAAANATSAPNKMGTRGNGRAAVIDRSYA